MDDELEFYPKRTEKRPLDRFRNQNALLQKFGEDGIKAYDAIDGSRSAAEISQLLSLDREKMLSILNFMRQNGMIATGGEQAASGPIAPIVPPSEELNAPVPGKDATMPIPPSPVARPWVAGAQKPSGGMPVSKQWETQAPQERQGTPASTQRETGGQEKPISAPEVPESQPPKEEEAGPGSTRLFSHAPSPPAPKQAQPGYPRVSQKAAYEEAGQPIAYPKREQFPPVGKEQNETPKPAEKFQYPQKGQGGFPPVSQPYVPGGMRPPQQPPTSRQALASDSESSGTISPSAPGSEQSGEQQPKGSEGLSPLEKLIFGRYGELGILVYNLIDGQRTAEEIMMETGISEVKLVEILEFMDNQGIIKLERPQEEEVEAPPEQPELKPMVEEKEPENLPEEATDEQLGIVPIDIPVPNEGNILQKVEVNALLTFKFGKIGPALLSTIDGKRDLIDLAVATKLSLPEIDTVMGFIGSHNLVTFRALTREEIKKKYGEDGYMIYKKFGRDGLLLYELIGKEGSLRDIIVESKIDPERAVDIFMFIHSVLGLDLPLDKEMLYRQLGIKKPYQPGPSPINASAAPPV